MITLLTLFSLTVHIQMWTATDGYGLGTCTAVYVSPTEALTAAHCVADTTGHIWVRTAKQKSFTATVVKKDVIRDLCLLHIEGPKHAYAKLGKPVDRGDKIYIMSSEMDMPFTYGEGIVGNILTDPEINQTLVIHTATLLHGASGSGLFNAEGKLVGINIYAIKGLGGAVDLTNIQEFLK